jgi:4-deoxy-L-threo-5-hexosulose-uronate ketol-isomerase
MTYIPATGVREYERMTTEETRAALHLGGLFVPGQIQLRYWETDRTVVGAAVPNGRSLTLKPTRELAAEHFLERRELGVINLGGAGYVTVDGEDHILGTHDGLYVGRGAKKVVFGSAQKAQPAQFYLLSYPAHAVHPTTRIARADLAGVALGSAKDANDRRIFKYIHTGGVKSCQLVMGMTVLSPGSVWNTMPPHTHSRRSEVYLYFDLHADAAVFHLFGEPNATRHVVVRDREAVFSPPWSIHSGVGTASYAFIWGMGGENQEFSDMDPAPVRDLR